MASAQKLTGRPRVDDHRGDHHRRRACARMACGLRPACLSGPDQTSVVYPRMVSSVRRYGRHQRRASVHHRHMVYAHHHKASAHQGYTVSVHHRRRVCARRACGGHRRCYCLPYTVCRVSVGHRCYHRHRVCAVRRYGACHSHLRGGRCCADDLTHSGHHGYRLGGHHHDGHRHDLHHHGGRWNSNFVS